MTEIADDERSLFGAMFAMSCLHFLIDLGPYYVLMGGMDFLHHLRPIDDWTILPLLLSIVPAGCIAKMAHDSHWPNGKMIGVTFLSAITYPLWSLLKTAPDDHTGYWLGPIVYSLLMVVVTWLRRTVAASG